MAEKTLKFVSGWIVDNFGLLLVAFLILVLAIVAWLFLINKSPQPTISSSSTGNPSLSIAEIQDIMHPKNTTDQVATPAAPVPAPAPTPVAANPPAPAPAAPVQPANQPPQYQNSSLGFAVTLPAGWTATPQPGGNGVIFYPQTARTAGNAVEVYQTADGSLDSIASQLQQSSSVSNVKRTTLFGQPAVSFSNNGRLGAALINNHRLYYIFGELVSGQLANNFHFI